MHRLVLPLLAVLLLWPMTAGGQDGSLHWRELAVTAQLDEEGRLHVRERQAMVFNGNWNGGEREFAIRSGQELRLRGIHRIDPATGARTALTQVDGDEIDEVNEFAWADGDVVRWRSRLASDPPFRNEEIVYELEYTLWPVIIPTGDAYELRHDFAFANRDGVIERLQVDLALDPAWETAIGNQIRETAEGLPPGRGYVISLPLRHSSAGEPLTGSAGAGPVVRVGVLAGAMLVPILVLVGLRRREAELDRVAPITPPHDIRPDWLSHHIFAYPADVVGTAWDRSVGQAEVAALLARLVEEGKLTSRVESDDDDEPVLHLRRVAPMNDFEPHERELLDGLFFDGGDETDTAAVREHYKSSGFDPAGKIREGLTARLDSLPGEGKVERRWLPAVLAILVGIGMSVLLPDGTGRVPLVVLSLGLAGIAALFALPFAVVLSRRVTHRTGLATGIVLALSFPAVLLAFLALGIFHSMGALVFYRPGNAVLLGLLVLLAGIGLLTTALTKPTETVERLGFRRRLVSAREFFERELERPEPRLQDRWFPYLLAFGLGSHIDKWFQSFGAAQARGLGGSMLASSAIASGAASAGGSGGGWTGGGPQFGGGNFGGGGAGGAWGVAAAGMAAGVAAPASTGGGGGGSASSGGGGGGGW